MKQAMRKTFGLFTGVIYEAEILRAPNMIERFTFEARLLLSLKPLTISPEEIFV